MQIAMLGPLEVRADSGAPLEVGGTRLRTLLILLALDAGRVATTQRLIDGVWGEAPPVGAANALQALVSRLRRALLDVPVESHPAGYRLAVRPDEVDIRRFEQLVATGRAALAHDPARAAEVLREALALWRGPALAEVAGAGFARAPAARLTELRLSATEDRIEADFRLGSGDRLVPELEELVADYPLRERVVGQLIRALCAAGRPADALTAYERNRTELAEQLGVDPSPALTALHLAVLRGDPGLVGHERPGTGVGPAAGAEPAVPAEADARPDSGTRGALTIGVEPTARDGTGRDGTLPGSAARDDTARDGALRGSAARDDAVWDEDGAARDGAAARVQQAPGAGLGPLTPRIDQPAPGPDPTAHRPSQGAQERQTPDRPRASTPEERASTSEELASTSEELVGDAGSRAGEGAGPSRTNLRAGLTSFVGRAEDIFRVGKLIGESRLVTLTGPGGAGKTRLATESARTLIDQMPDGVWLVELAPVTDPGELPQSVLSALGLREQALLAASRGRPPGAVELNEPLVRLVAALADKRMLLVLDNCEHLIQAAAALADRLLGECPQLRVLATSREPLGITGENLWPVESLAMPPQDAPVAEVTAYPSVRLLADRAAAVRPSFTVDESTVTAVVRICRALDGMPLAIELAAARLRALTPEQVAVRLDNRFRLLTAGSRTALPRHQTLRAVVDWSWELLDDAERTLWRRLAVFAGGATLAAAEQVCADPAIAPADVLDLLTALVDKSLLVVTDGQPRYRMLETIRAYGLERLAEAGEEERIRRAHSAYFLAFTEAAEPGLRGPEQLDCLARLTDDHDNLHAALRTAVTSGDTLTALRLVGALGWYWWLCGRRVEGVELAAEVLGMTGEVPAAVRAQAYAIAALNGIESHLRDTDTLRGWFEASVRLTAQSTAEAAQPAQAAAAEGGAAASSSPYPLLRLVGPMATMFEANGDEHALPAVEALFDDPDPWIRALTRMIRAHVLLNLGRRHDQAQADFTTALDGFRALGERWGMAFSLTALAELRGWDGDHASALAALEEALARIAELGTVEDIPQLQVRYANELWLLDERDRARAVLDEAHRLAERTGLPETLAMVKHAFGDLARREGDLARAREHLGQAAAGVRTSTVSPQFEAMIASSAGLVENAAGEWGPARAQHATALERAMHSRDAPVIAMVLVGIADLALRTGDPARAAVLVGAAAAIRGKPSGSNPDAEQVQARAEAALDAPAFAEAYQRGHATAIDGVAELTGPLPGRVCPAHPEPRPEPDGSAGLGSPAVPARPDGPASPAVPARPDGPAEPGRPPEGPAGPLVPDGPDRPGGPDGPGGGIAVESEPRVTPGA